MFSREYENAIWHDSESSPSFSRSFVRLVQLYSYKIDTTLTGSIFIVYPIKFVFLHNNSVKGEWIITNGYKIIEFLSFSRSDYIIHEDDVVENIVAQNTVCQVLQFGDGNR